MLTPEQRIEAEQIRAAALRLEARARAALPTAGPTMQKRLNEDLAQLDNLIHQSDAILAANALPPMLSAAERSQLTQMMAKAKETVAQWAADLDEAKRAGATDKVKSLEDNLATMNAFVAFLTELEQVQDRMPIELSKPVIKSGFGADGPWSFFAADRRSN